jgi:hypothetical protein
MNNKRWFGLLLGCLLAGCSALGSNNDTDQDEQAEQRSRCEVLEREIEELEGKPLRRTAARQYYEQECLSPRY